VDEWKTPPNFQSSFISFENFKKSDLCAAAQRNTCSFMAAH